jgi:endonuclease-3
MKEKAKIIQEILNSHFPDPKPPLVYKNPYTLLIAVLLSAQCTDKRVNEVTQSLFLKADSPEKMVQIGLEEIQQIIRPCGLYRAKSKAILQLSEILIRKFNSQIPRTLKALQNLPGVGHKTASVVYCQCYQQPAFPIDTHIHRCAKRWGLTQGKNVEETEKDLKKVFPKNSWSKLHLQIIFYARAFCKARGHVEKNCPICAKVCSLA